MCLNDFQQAAKILQTQLKEHNCSDVRIKKFMTDTIKGVLAETKSMHH